MPGKAEIKHLWSSLAVLLILASVIWMKGVMSSHTQFCVHSEVPCGLGLKHQGMVGKAQHLQSVIFDGSGNCSSFSFEDIKSADFSGTLHKIFM